jgi:RNA polymerase sigma factor (sigma-70 family)
MYINYSGDVKQFECFFTTNYDKFSDYCTNYSISADVLHDVYLKIHKRVSMSGFTDTGRITYVINSLVNTNLNEKKSLKNKNVVYIVDDNSDKIEINLNKIENILQEIDDHEKIKVEEELQAQYIVSKLFKFLQYEIRCSEMELMIFKIYYLSKSKMSYDKISRMTGVNKNRITTIMRKIKEQLKLEFKNYLQHDDN